MMILQVEFFQLFNMGYQNYSQGEWQAAGCIFYHFLLGHVVEAVKSYLRGESHPSTLLSFSLAHPTLTLLDDEDDGRLHPSFLCEQVTTSPVSQTRARRFSETQSG